MSYNGSGTFQINTSGQPVVAGTVISSTAFNALTADLATGLSTAITKDGQTTTTARIPFAAGINSTLTTDASSVGTGSIITGGGVGIAKALYVGTTTNLAGAATLGSTLTYGGVTLTNAVTGTGKMVLDTSPTISGITSSGANLSLPIIDNIKMGYTTTATAAGTTTLTAASNYRQFFTGSTTQTIVLPVTSTLVTGIAYEIENNSTGLLTVNSSGGNLVGTIPAGVCAHAVCIATATTTAADWDWDYISNTSITGTGSAVLATSPTITTPTITTPTIDTITSAAATALTLKSAGTTALTISTSQAATFASTVADSVAILRPLVSGTATNTTGTSVSITGIPSWVKRITVMFNNVTISAGTNPSWVIRIGPSGGVESTGYVAMSVSGGTVTTSTTGFNFRGNGVAGAATDGTFTLSLQNSSTNTWCASGLQYHGNGWQGNAGTKSLAGTLTQLALVTNGTDTFTAGSVNILYE
jgi:hypothetical protein